MRHIDAFCHFFPSGIFRLMSETAGGTTDVGKRMQGVRTIHDLDARFRMMDQFDDYTQILSLGLPPLEGMVGPDRAPELARVANDGLAELVAKHPGPVRRLRRRAADERTRRRGQGSRADPAQRQRQRIAAPYQCERRVPR